MRIGLPAALCAAVLLGGAGQPPEPQTQPASAPAAELESLERRLTALWGRPGGFSARLVAEYTVRAENSHIRQQFTGTLECARSQTATLYRIDAEGDFETRIQGGTPFRLTSRTTLVCDGRNAWRLDEQLGVQTVVRMRPHEAALGLGAAPPVGDPQLFARLREEYDLHLRGPEDLPQGRAWVLEARRRTPRAGDPVVTRILHILPDSGVIVQMTDLDHAQEPIARVRLEQIDLTARPDPQRFTFQPPPGAKVRDRTGGPDRRRGR